jgi:hypothetical protein
MCNSVDTLLGYLVLTWKGLLFSIPVVEVTIDEKNDTKHRSLRLSSVAVYTGTKEAGGESVMYRSNIAMEFCAKLIDLALSERHTATSARTSSIWRGWLATCTSSRWMPRPVASLGSASRSRRRRGEDARPSSTYPWG